MRHVDFLAWCQSRHDMHGVALCSPPWHGLVNQSNEAVPGFFFLSVSVASEKPPKVWRKRFGSIRLKCLGGRVMLNSSTVHGLREAAVRRYMSDTEEEVARLV